MQGNFKLQIEEGEFTDSEIIVMLGENGTGKTTFIRMIHGSIDPDDAEDKEKIPQFNVSYKPQKISPKFPGSVSFTSRCRCLWIESLIGFIFLNDYFIPTNGLLLAYDHQQWKSMCIRRTLQGTVFKAVCIFTCALFFALLVLLTLSRDTCSLQRQVQLLKGYLLRFGSCFISASETCTSIHNSTPTSWSPWEWRCSSTRRWRTFQVENSKEWPLLWP